MTEATSKLHDLFDELVPSSGKAETVAGEIVRATNHIIYRNLNDGDHIGVSTGKETCNPAARYIMAHCNEEIRKTVCDMWGMVSDRVYDAAAHLLSLQVVDYLENNPELRERGNNEDMWEYRILSEDIDDEQEEE